MKNKAIKYVTLLFIVSMFMFVTTVNAQQKERAIKDSIMVKGNCDMCKKKIESAADLKGVKWVEWQADKQLLFVEYVQSKITLDKIQQKIAEAGYDTEKYKATDAAYKKLHTCCKYER